MGDAREHFRILVADDERPVLDAYATVLADINAPLAGGANIEALEAKLFGPQHNVQPGPKFTSVLCRGGEAAIEALRASTAGDPPFALAFLDVRMPPGIDGIETAARLRALDPNINIVIVTAYSDSHPREIAQRVPPLDKLFYVSKPFQKMELQQFVLALTAKWKSERALRDRCRELEAANAGRRSAELASQSKSEFLANMSHELRTPLNAVIGFADVIRCETYGPIGNERYRQYVEDIGRSGTHLLRVINDLLDTAKIDAGKLAIEIEDVDPDVEVGQVLSLVQVQVEQAELSVVTEACAKNVLLRADPHRLRQVLLNLLSNAIKFTPKGGRITVKTAIAPDRTLTIAVTDSGIGMSRADIETALEPFGQVERGLARNYQGTGLGLTIARKLAELQGATLEVDSEPDRGTTVGIRFPEQSYALRPERKRAGQH